MLLSAAPPLLNSTLHEPEWSLKSAVYEGLRKVAWEKLPTVDTAS